MLVVIYYCCDLCVVFRCVPLQIGNVLDSYAATLTKRGDHDVFYMTTQGVSQLVQRSVLSHSHHWVTLTFDLAFRSETLS